MVRSICIYCASSNQVPQPYVHAARRLGRLLGQHHITLVNGAGNMGLMRAAADACMAAGGQTLGIIPRFMIDEGWAHQGMTQLIVTPDMHTRQQQMMQHSDALYPAFRNPGSDTVSAPAKSCHALACLILSALQSLFSISPGRTTA